MIDYEHSDLFYEDSIKKSWTLTFTKEEDGTTQTVAVIENDQILNDSIIITESLSSGDGLVFGRCEANRFEVTIYNQNSSLKGCTLIVEVALGEYEPFTIGTYKVDSDKTTADRYHRKVTAYDDLYDINEKDVADWYAGLTFPITLKNFRDSFFEYVGVEQEETELINDSMSIRKTIETVNGISGNSIITAICEINGAFGHIGRDNVFHYVRLHEIVQGLYPRNDLYPSDELYPKREIVDATINRNEWSNVEYEDYTVKEIDAVVILSENGEIAVSTKTDTTNPLNIENNFLLYDLNNSELTTVANNLFDVVEKLNYIPAKVDCLANPCVEIGDSLRFNTKEAIIFTFVLTRTITGCQYLVDTIESSGEEDRSKDLNSISKQLARLAAKSEYDLEASNARISYLEADHVTVAQLNAANANINALSANVVSISGSLSAAIGRINTIESDYIKTAQLEAVNAKFDNINANNITTGSISFQRITSALSTNTIYVKNLYANEGGTIQATNGAVISGTGSFDRISLGGHTYTGQTKTINGVTIHYLGY